MLAVLFVSMIVGLVRGVVFEMLAVAGWFVAYFAAQWAAPQLSPYIPIGVTGSAIYLAVTLVIGFFVALVVWTLLARLVRMLIHATPLSVVDRLGGAGFGALRGVFIALLLVLVVGASPLAESGTWQASRAAPVLAGVLRDAAPMLPEPIARFVSRSMTPSEAESTD